MREGFIIDDEDEEPEDRERRRRKDKKRRRAEREEEEAVLDEEDLDLIGEANPEWERKTAAQACTFGNVFSLSDFSASQNSSVLSVDIEMMAINTESAALTRSSPTMRRSTRRMTSTANLHVLITTEWMNSPTSSKRTTWKMKMSGRDTRRRWRWPVHERGVMLADQRPLG